jgi:hypothetical protein
MWLGFAIFAGWVWHGDFLVHDDLWDLDNQKIVLLLPLNRAYYRLLKVEVWVLGSLGDALGGLAYGFHLGVRDLERVSPLPLQEVRVETYGAFVIGEVHAESVLQACTQKLDLVL